MSLLPFPIRKPVRGRTLRPAAASVAAVAIAMFVLLPSPPLGAQAADSRAPRASQPAAASVSFEVASIKPDRRAANYIDINVHTTVSGNLFTARGVSAKDLVQMAYDLDAYQVSGGPAWAGSDKYDIDAKIDDVTALAWKTEPGTQQSGEFHSMLQSLLADRFHLKVSHHTRMLPIFALVVAKDGPKGGLAHTASGAGTDRPGSSSDGAPDGGIVTVETDVPLSVFARVLTHQPEFDGRPVLDETGLKGNYTFTLRWSREVMRTSGTRSPRPESSAPSIWTAVQEQLGLKLVSRKARTEMIVIDQIEPPTAD